MAKLSSINKNNKRIKLSKRLFAKRKKLKSIVMDKKHSYELLKRLNFPFKETRSN